MRILKSRKHLNSQLEEAYRKVMAGTAPSEANMEMVRAMDRFMLEMPQEWRTKYLAAKKSHLTSKSYTVAESMLLASRDVLAEMWESGILTFGESEDVNEYDDLWIN